MRRILTEYYSWLYRLTGIKLLSYISGLVYLTIINYIIVNGLAMLLQGWMSIVSMLLRLFTFPIGIVTFLLFLGLTYWLTPPVQTVAKDAKKNTSHTTLLLYTLFGVLLFLYIRFGDAFFV